MYKKKKLQNANIFTRNIYFDGSITGYEDRG